MGKLDKQLREDRALRDAAKRLIEADLGFVKGDVKDRGVGKRVAGRLGEGGLDVAGHALDYGKRRPFVVFGAVAAVLLFVFRNPILDLILDWLEDEDDDPEDELDEGDRETVPERTDETGPEQAQPASRSRKER